MHEADIAFLDQVRQAEAAIHVFLRDRYDQAQIGLDHLVLGAIRLAFAFAHGLGGTADLADRHPRFLGERSQLAADLHHPAA